MKCAQGRVEIRVGDCRETLRAMPAESVHCVVTSPPYFGLRDYGHEGQIGLEPTPAEFVSAMVETFREVRRVLRADGTCWVNLGDSYNAHPGQRKVTDKAGEKQQTNRGAPAAPSRHVPGLKPKDLIGISWRVAFALQDDGWYLRQDIIWHKPNPMPESVRDRCTKSHEYLFLLTKSPRYFYDAEAIKERSIHAGRVVEYDGDQKNVTAAADPKMRTRIATTTTVGDTRNRRSVWTVPSEPYSGAHFATYPPKLIEPCILAGCPKGGTVLDPFGGAGTTGLVAARHGRNAILCELNPKYAVLARDRIAAEWREPVSEADDDFGPLFARAAE